MLYLFLPIYYLAAATTAAATAAMVQPNILFLMCDSMDGRVLDPTSPVSERLEMPNLRKLASQGTNFINTYAASPQCVPSRTTMFAGRRIDQTRTWSNEQGLAGIPSTGRLDTECLRLFDLETCTEWQKNQNVSATLVDSLREVNCEACLYGKVDVGAGILQEEVNARANGYHTGPSLSILTRTADIRKATKPDPLSITNDYDNHVHQEDWKMIPKCIEFLKNAPKAGTFSAADKSWMLYCSINIPHPAFNTNSTWLKGVNTWKGKSRKSYSYLSMSLFFNNNTKECVKWKRVYNIKRKDDLLIDFNSHNSYVREGNNLIWNDYENHRKYKMLLSKTKVTILCEKVDF